MSSCLRKAVAKRRCHARRFKLQSCTHKFVVSKKRDTASFSQRSLCKERFPRKPKLRLNAFRIGRNIAEIAIGVAAAPDGQSPRAKTGPSAAILSRFPPRFALWWEAGRHRQGAAHYSQRFRASVVAIGRYCQWLGVCEPLAIFSGVAC